MTINELTILTVGALSWGATLTGLVLWIVRNAPL